VNQRLASTHTTAAYRDNERLPWPSLKPLV
jgi:hypothetical protein